MRKFALLPGLVACCAFGGCGAAVSSSRVATMRAMDTAVGRNNGEIYYLPRAVLVARLLASPTRGLRVVVDRPDIVADTGAALVTSDDPVPPDCAIAAPAIAGPFVLSHRITGFHKDTITIASSQSLLTSVVADTEEQTTEALTNLAKSVAAFSVESATLGDDEELLALRFDPASCREVAIVQGRLRTAIDGKGVARLQEMRADADATGPLAKLALAQRQPSDFKLSLSGFAPFRFANDVAASTDCRIGVCVPVQVPASLVVEVGGRRRESPILHLPNRSDPVAIPVSRSGFVDVKTTLTFDHGILTKREIVRTSEVAAILLLPATLVGAYLDELSATFKKRKSALDDEVAWRKAQDSAKEKTESADLTADSPLLDVPIPGLSIGSSPKVAAGPAQVQLPDNASPEASSESKETGRGDGNADPKPSAPVKGKANGKAN